VLGELNPYSSFGFYMTCVKVCKNKFVWLLGTSKHLIFICSTDDLNIAVYHPDGLQICSYLQTGLYIVCINYRKDFFPLDV